MPQSNSLSKDHGATSEQTLRDVLKEFQKAATEVVFSAPGLTSGTSTVSNIKVGNAVDALADGNIVGTSAGDEVAPPNVTVADGDVGIFVVTIDSSGTLQTYHGTDADDKDDAQFPSVPADEAMLGFVTVEPSSSDYDASNDDISNQSPTYYDTEKSGFNPNAISI